MESLEGDVSALEAQLLELQLRQAENADLTQQNRCHVDGVFLVQAIAQ